MSDAADEYIKVFFECTKYESVTAIGECCEEECECEACASEVCDDEGCWCEDYCWCDSYCEECEV